MTEPTPGDSNPNAGEAYVSTGSLPSRDEVRALVETAHERFAREAGGKIADYIPALAEADPAHFGICVTSTRGESFAVAMPTTPSRSRAYPSPSSSRSCAMRSARTRPSACSAWTPPGSRSIPSWR